MAKSPDFTTNKIKLLKDLKVKKFEVSIIICTSPFKPIGLPNVPIWIICFFFT